MLSVPSFMYVLKSFFMSSFLPMFSPANFPSSHVGTSSMWYFLASWCVSFLKYGLISMGCMSCFMT